MKAMIIDPHNHTLSRVDNDGSAEAIRDLLHDQWGGGGHMVYRWPSGKVEYGYCDDEGYYREKQAFFSLSNYPYPLAGRMVIYGMSGPNNTSTSFKASTLRPLITWRDDIEFERLEVIERNTHDGFVHQTYIPHFRQKRDFT